VRAAAKGAVQDYFRGARPQLNELGCDPEKVDSLDTLMQRLLRLANGRNRRQSYLQVLRDSRDLRLSLEAERELHLGEQLAGTSATESQLSDVERQIIETLHRMVPSAAQSYEQALRDLGAGGRLSYRGTANDLREALREAVDYLAPDEDVMGATGFRLEEGQTQPTQKQKVRFILRSREQSITAARAPEDAISLVEELTASFARSVSQRTSISTHVAKERQEVMRIKQYVDTVLVELLEVHT
jgi:hypothetical protein